MFAPSQDALENTRQDIDTTQISKPILGSDSKEINEEIHNRVLRSLFDPEEISSKHSPVQHQSLKSEIDIIKRKTEQLRKAILAKEAKLQEIQVKIEKLKKEKTKKNLELEETINSISTRLKKFLRIKQTAIVQIQMQIKEIEDEINKISIEASKVNSEIIQLKLDLDSIPNTDTILENYNSKAKLTPLTVEEKYELLKPEILSQLTTEEYISLWRRLNPFFLSHVTRQGFRDHSGMIYHSHGMQEFHNGLTSILSDEKGLRPPITTSHGLRSRDEEAVTQFLKNTVLDSSNEQEALERFERLLDYSIGSAPAYADKTAIHFAAEIVADKLYGGEKNNEVFVIYPSDFLASQYNFAFNGFEKDFTKPQTEDKWNDVFIWPQSVENPKISIDAGIMFLPEDTKVDPETGSKYDSEETNIGEETVRVMIQDNNLVSAFSNWIQTLTEESRTVVTLNQYLQERNPQYQRLILKNLIEQVVQEMRELGFDYESAREIATNLLTNDEITSFIKKQKTVNKESIVNFLKECNASWKRAVNPITAKEYWTNFFKKNQHLKPKHIVFYTGSPTTAVKDFLTRNQITNIDQTSANQIFLGFKENYIDDMKNDPRANIGYDDLKTTGKKIIQDHYKNTSQ